jgi:hypothetical protein
MQIWVLLPNEYAVFGPVEERLCLLCTMLPPNAADDAATIPATATNDNTFFMTFSFCLFMRVYQD